MNASGALCVTRAELEALGRSRSGAIVTKSMTLEARTGNPEPRYYPFAGGSINSMGLPNLGYRAYAELIPALKAFRKPVIASVAGLCEDDFPEIARTIARAGPDLIEVNLSCPNLPGKPQIGYEFEASERLIRRVRAVVDCPMGVKLPPYFDPAHHAAMAEVLKRAPVDFLSLINSVGNALVIDTDRESVVIKPKGGFGGVGGVALGVAVYVAVATANVEIVRSFEQAVLGVAGRTALQVFNATNSLDGFDERIIEPLSHADGVLLATPVLDLTGIWRTEGSARGIVLPILGVDLLAESSFRDYRVVESSHDTSGSESDWERYLEPDTIFVGRRLAQRHGLTLGSALEVNVGGRLRRLVVRGILEGDGPARSTFEELAVMDIAAAQLLFDRLGRLDRIDLVTDPARPVEEVRRAVLARLPPELTVKRPQQRNAQIERMTRAFRLNVSILSVVALLVGLFLVYNTVSFAVLRRRREIGILRSLGLSSAGIARLLLAEVVLVGIVGGVVGIGFGVALSNGVLQTLAATVSNLYYQSLVPPRLAWVSSDVLVQGLLIGLVVAVVGSLGPIREAVSVEPTQALAPGGYELVGTVRVATVIARAAASCLLAWLAAVQDPVQGVPLFGYVAVFLVVLGFAWLSPVVIRAIAPCLRRIPPRWAGCLPGLAAAELERAPVRNAVAVSALMVGLALMIGVSVMIHSFRQTVELWLEQTVKADLIVAPPTWLGDGPEWALPESVHQRLQALPGVVAADSYRDVRMDYRDRPVRVVARDLLIHAQHSRYLFVEGESATVLSEAVRSEQVIVSETFARQFSLRRGDRIGLPTPHGPVELPIAGVFYDYSTDGGKIVLDRALYARHWRDRDATVG